MNVSDLAVAHTSLRRRSPLVQNITNTVVQQFSANVLLAIGASPAMLDHEADAAQFAAIADALLVNFGTATNQQLLAADVAIDAARQHGKSWVLDPVSAGVVDFRTRKIRQALAAGPTVLRGNASEILALAGLGRGGRGVDATDEVSAALPAAVALAREHGSVVAVSGAVDNVVAVRGEEVRVAYVSGGHALMARVVGTGCALGSTIAAYLGGLGCGTRDSLESAFTAAVAAHAHFAMAGSAAARVTQAPGSFAVSFLDALYAIRSKDFAAAPVRFEALPLRNFE